MGEMTASIAHEINQPLTAISMYAQASLKLLERDGSKDKVKDALEIFIHSSEKNVADLVPLSEQLDTQQLTQAEAFAARISNRPTNGQLAFAHLLAFGRNPSPEERQLASLFAQSFRREMSGTGTAEIQRRTLVAYCHALLCAAEFSVID